MDYNQTQLEKMDKKELIKIILQQQNQINEYIAKENQEELQKEIEDEQTECIDNDVEIEIPKQRIGSLVDEFQFSKKQPKFISSNSGDDQLDTKEFRIQQLSNSLEQDRNMKKNRPQLNLHAPPMGSYTSSRAYSSAKKDLYDQQKFDIKVQPTAKKQQIQQVEIKLNTNVKLEDDDSSSDELKI